MEGDYMMVKENNLLQQLQWILIGSTSDKQ